MTPDPIAELRDLLLADTAVQALVGERVYGAEIPRGLNDEMPIAAVVLSPAGGPGRPGTVKYRRTRVDTICYGATLAQAWRVHSAVREALETFERPTGSVVAVETSSDGSLARGPVTQWPTCYASYLALSHTETTVP